MIMETQFYILLSLKTPEGFDTYGQYFFGNDREAAEVLFHSLSGNRDSDTTALLHIDLMETVDELPVKIRSVSCTLDELGHNTKIIARETFRRKNLKEWGTN